MSAIAAAAAAFQAFIAPFSPLGQNRGDAGGGKMMVYEREKRPRWSSPDHRQQQQQHQMMALAAGGRSVSEEIILSSSHPCVGMWKYEVQVPRCIKKSPDLFCDCSVLRDNYRTIKDEISTQPAIQFVKGKKYAPKVF
jgi:hypothetical protein